MASQAWQLAGEIVRAALKRPPHERAAYLAAACAGNDALRQEVETLLRYHSQPEMHSGSLLNSPSLRQSNSASSWSAGSSNSTKPVHPLTQTPKASEPLPVELPVTPNPFNAPTVRMETAPVVPEPAAPEANLAEPLKLAPMPENSPASEESEPLDWLARLTEEEPKLFQTPPANPLAAPSVPASALSSALSEEKASGKEPLPTTPTHKTGARPASFESLFKRVTLPPAPGSSSKPASAPKAPTDTAGSLDPTEVFTGNSKSFETDIIPPPTPLPPTEVFVSAGKSFETEIIPPEEAAPKSSSIPPASSAPYEPSVVGAAASARLNQSGAFTSGAKTLDGRMLGPYQLLYEIGRGGMGRVYLAEDTRLGRRVALKMLLRSSTRSPEKVKRFEQEARAASSLNHPNILTIYEIGQIKGVHYLATEYVEGPTLRHMIDSRRIQLLKILDIAEQVADALAAAHDANIVHRDIKPENLMLRLDGYVKVLDFGIAKLLEKNTGGPIEIPTTQPFDTQPGAIVGTVDYMSPEQARGLRIDKRTDIFSLGVVLYEMVTGIRPFTGVTPTDVVAALLTRDPIPVTQRLVGAPEALHRIIKRALAKEREERYQSARDLARDLGALKQDIELAARVGRSTGQTSQRQTPPSGSMSPASPRRNTERPPQPRTAPRPATSQRQPQAQPSGSQPAQGQTARRPQPPPPQGPPSMGRAPQTTGRAPQTRPSGTWQQAPEPSTARPSRQNLNQSYGRSAAAREATQPTIAPNRRTGSKERNKIGFWPWFLFLSALIGLGAGIWANYYRMPEVVGLAVMPFTATRLSGSNVPATNEDEDALRQALIEGLHESLLQRLSPLPRLQMIARNSMRNLPKDTPMRDIGKYLDVNNVLTGRIVTRGSAVTVSVEMHDAATGEARWSQRYERTLSDLHTLPEALANDVGQQLPFELNAVQTARIARRETSQAEAFQQYLRGRYLWQQRQPETIKTSLQYLRKAIELDPNYARAHAGLAEAYATAPLYGVMSVSEALPLCRTEAAKALQLDGQLAEAYRVQGFVLHQYEMLFPAAEKAFQRALELNANLAQAHQEYGSLLSCLGRHEDGIAQAQMAETLDPLASATVTNTAAAYYYAGRYQEALDMMLRARTIGPNKPGVYKFLGLIYQQMQRPGDALEALVKALTLAPKETELRAQLVCAQAGSGNHAEALKQLDDLRALPEAQALTQYRLATIYAALGDKERALVALTQAVAKKEPGVVWMKVDPQLNSLQQDQRFKEMSKQIGLP